MLVRASSSTCSEPSTRHCRDRPVVTQRGSVVLSRCQLRLLFPAEGYPPGSPSFHFLDAEVKSCLFVANPQKPLLGRLLPTQVEAVHGMPRLLPALRKTEASPCSIPSPAARCRRRSGTGGESRAGSSARRGDGTGAAPGVSPAAGAAPGAAVWGRPRGCPRLRPAPGPPLHPGMGRPS